MKKEDYYIDLIINKCILLSKNKNVFISYNSFNEAFIQKLILRLRSLKIKEIYLECIDPFFEHEILKKYTLKEIEESNYFDQSIYNDYAKKKAAFLFFISPVPGLMDDIEPEKLALVSKIKTDSKKFFVDQEISYKISWSILPLYNVYWENSLNINNLEDILYDICLVNKNVLDNWNSQIKRSREIVNKINNLKLTALIFKNSLGTDLKVGLPENYKFKGVGDTEILVNLPSYEIFTSPNYKDVEGKVYSSKPLYYNGAVVENFYMEFSKGKVINFGAKKGKKILENIINFDKGSSYLGEVALVEKTSPISKTNIVFKTTLLDENASCHLALGRGFGDGNKEQLKKQCINYSDIHVDFMIGNDDLNVVGIKDNQEIIIMKNGKFVI